jgi:hypothetical protein
VEKVDEGNWDGERGFWGWGCREVDEGEVGGWKKDKWWLKFCLHCGGWVVPAVVEQRWLSFLVQLERQHRTNRTMFSFVITVFCFIVQIK